MAIAVDTTGSAAFSGSGAYTQNFTCSGIQRLLVVVAAGIRNSTSAWTWGSGTYNGVAMTQQAAGQSPGGSRNVGVSVWTLVNPPSGAAYTVSITPGPSLMAATVAVMSLTGVDQTTPTGNANTDTGQKAGYSASITTGAANAWLVGGASVRNGTLTWTPGTDVTELLDSSTGSSLTDDVATMMGYLPCAAAGSYAFAATASAGTPYGVLAAVEVRAAAVAPADWYGAEAVLSAGGVWMF